MSFARRGSLIFCGTAVALLLGEGMARVTVAHRYRRWGVTEEASFPQLAAGLVARKTRRPVRALNLAVPGCNSWMEVESLVSRMEAIDPDVVVMQWVANDADLPNFIYPTPDVWAVDRSYLWDVLLRPGDALLHPSASRPVMAKKEKTPDGQTVHWPNPDQVPSRYRRMVGEQGVAAEYRRLNQACTDRGIPVVLTYSLSPPHPFVQGLARELGWQVVEPLALAEDRRGFRVNDLRLLPEDPHSNAKGHHMISEAVAEEIRAAAGWL